MKFALMLGALVAFVVPAYGQCDCADEKLWTSVIALREATLKKVIATGNKDAIDAVVPLIVGAGLEPSVNALGNSDPVCTKMTKALADESEAEREMVATYYQSLRKGRQDKSSSPKKQ